MEKPSNWTKFLFPDTMCAPFLRLGLGFWFRSQSLSQFYSVYDAWILSVFVLGQLIKSLSHFSLKIEIYVGIICVWHGMVWYSMNRSRTISHFHIQREKHITTATPLPCEWLLLITFLEQTKWIFMLWLSIFDTHTGARRHTHWLWQLSFHVLLVLPLFMHARRIGI